MIGFILFIIGISIRMVCIKQMKSFNLNIVKPKTVKTDGIYKYIRHPSYLGSLISLYGLSLISIKLSFMYLCFIFFLSRAISEEYLLKDNDEYKNYSLKTGMFFPKIGRG